MDTLFPGTAERIVFQESATPLSHMRYTRASSGSGYGLAATPGQFALARPHTKIGPKGLYIAGASARSGHGVMAAIRSGRTTALELGRDLA
jgi:all-trans-retinol 13,14-reductase